MDIARTRKLMGMNFENDVKDPKRGHGEERTH
jgi:hypothetical protein